jgi:hypothetical protein
MLEILYEKTTTSVTNFEPIKSIEHTSKKQRDKRVQPCIIS